MKTYALSYNKEIINNRAAVAAIGVIFFILATALGAYVRIPVGGSPVPITLQTFFVLLSGAALGRRLGAFSQFGYLVLGASGLPIFQGASFGAPYLLSPTAGYLVGFIFAAYLTGRMIEFKPSDMKWIFVSFLAGSLVIYAFGVSWLICLYRMNAANAVSVGILPFIPGDIAKILFATVIYSRISHRSNSVNPV